MRGFLFLLVAFAAAHSPHDLISAVGASADGQFVMAIVRNTLVRSFDYGDNWELANRGLPNPSFNDRDQASITVSPSFDAVRARDHFERGPHVTVVCLIAQTTYGGASALFISRDAGRRWEEFRSADDQSLTPAVFEPNLHVSTRIVPYAVSANYANDGVIVLAVKRSSSDAILYRAAAGQIGLVPVNGGQPLCHGCPRYAMIAAYGGVFLAGARSQQLFLSIDGGLSWQLAWGPVDGHAGADITSVATQAPSSDGTTLPVLVGLTSGNVLALECKISALSAAPLCQKRQDGPSTISGMPGSRFPIDASADPHYSVQTVLAGFPVVGNDSLATWYAVGQSAWRYSEGSWSNVFGETDDVLYMDVQADLYLEANYSQVVACKGGYLYLGGFAGVLRSADGGKSWLRLDTLSSLLTSMDVGPSNKYPDGVRLLTCAYRAACFEGEFSIGELKAAGRIPAGVLTKYWPRTAITASKQLKEDLERCTYFYVQHSPTFLTDRLLLGACTRSKGILRSTTGGKTWTRVPLPLVKNIPCKYRGCVSESGGSHDEYSKRQLVHSIAFSPDFAADKTVFAGGFGVGVARSTNGGVSFTTVWDGCGKGSMGPNGECLSFKTVRVAVSPSFGTDAHIVAMVFDANTFADGYLFLSEDGGSQWMLLTSDEDASGLSRPHTWANVAVGQAGGPPVVLAVETRYHEGSRATVLTLSGGASRYQMRELPLPERARGACRDGFGYQGLALADDFAHSGEFVIGCSNGGVFVLRLNTSQPHMSALELVQMSKDGPWQSSGSSAVVSTWSASITIHPPDNQARCSMGNTISYSPHYAFDGVIFAASYYSIVASFDRGATWTHVHRLNHTSTGHCDVDLGLDGCATCQHTLPPSCVVCKKGYVRTPYKLYVYTHDTPELSEECIKAEGNQSMALERVRRRQGTRLKMRKYHVRSAANTALATAQKAGVERNVFGR